LAQRLVAQADETFSVAEMARAACASPWHFLRRFQAATGMTPHAFLLNCRVRRLRSLLRGRVTAADAAASTGFADQSHMHKLFKLHHNLTPRQFVLASSRLDEPDEAAC
jgi:transcriptional regulator GlxA family with amidase domain